MEIQIIEYLKNPLLKKDLENIKSILKIEPERLIRKTESIYKEKYKGKSLSKKEVIEAMIKHPILIERPIVLKDDRAVIGRPPENVLDLFK